MIRYFRNLIQILRHYRYNLSILQGLSHLPFSKCIFTLATLTTILTPSMFCKSPCRFQSLTKVFIGYRWFHFFAREVAVRTMKIMVMSLWFKMCKSLKRFSRISVFQMFNTKRYCIYLYIYIFISVCFPCSRGHPSRSQSFTKTPFGKREERMLLFLYSHMYKSPIHHFYSQFWEEYLSAERWH